MDAEDIRFPVPWGYISGKTYGSASSEHKVLIVHGWTDNCATFDLLIPLLDTGYLYIVSIDLSGHGQSSHLPIGIPYHVIEYMATIRRIVRLHLKWTRFDYIGHSFGSGLGTMYASIYPEEIKHLIVIDYVKLLNWNSSDTRQEYETSTKEFLAIDRQRQAAVTIPQISFPLSRLCSLYVQATDGELNDKEAGVLLKRGTKQLELNSDKWTLSRDVGIRNIGTFQFSHEGMFSILSAIRCSTLFIKAKFSNWKLDVTVINQIVDICKTNCKLFKLLEVDANHFVPLSKPIAIAAPINEFLLEI